MAFPTSPTNGQQANINGITYTYSNTVTAWTVSTSVSNTFVSINVSDNVNSGNVLATGVISATGNVSGGNLVVTGNIIDTGALTIVTGSNGNITLSPDGTGIVTTTGAISTTGNISANNATFTSNQTLSYGTANGVVYLNSSKVLTTGSALVFNGTNLGVGTSSPATKLNVAVSAANETTSALRVTNLNASGYGIGIEFADELSSGRVAARIATITPGTSATGDLYFQTRTASALTEKMRLTSGGDLVVGATATRGTYKLDIRSDTSIAIGSNATYYGTIGYSAGTGYLSLASEAGGAAGIKCLNGTTTLSIIDLNSLYAYVGVNPSNSGTTNARIFNSSAGAGTVTLYIGNQSITTSSDVRLKENIVDTQRNALEILGQLRVVDHTWNDPSDQCENNRNSRGTWMGLIAQEAQPIIPWLVNKPTADVDENGDPQYWHMDYGYSVPLLVKAIQEQQALITQLTARITALEEA